MYCNAQLTVGELKQLLDKVSDDTPVKYKDPNFSGEYYVLPDLDDFLLDGGMLLIKFPFETPLA